MIRRRLRFVIGAGLVAPIVLSGCTQAAQQRGARMSCERTGGGIDSAVVLMAQAVPTAGSLPCIQTFPSGWSVGSFEARSGFVRITFDSDRAGMRIFAVTLEQRCTVHGTPMPPTLAGATGLHGQIHRFEQRYQATWYYTLPGACMMYGFDFPLRDAGQLLTDAVSMIRLLPRKTIKEQLNKAGFDL